MVQLQCVHNNDNSQPSIRYPKRKHRRRRCRSNVGDRNLPVVVALLDLAVCEAEGLHEPGLGILPHTVQEHLRDRPLGTVVEPALHGCRPMGLRRTAMPAAAVVT